MYIRGNIARRTLVVLALSATTFLALTIPSLADEDPFDKGMNFMRQGNFAQALECFDALAKKDPKQISYLGNRALCYQRLNEYDKALIDLNAILQIDPKDSQTHNNRGVLLVRMNKPEDAIKDFNRALKLGHRRPWIVYGDRAIALEQLGRLNEALEDVNRALQHDVNDAHWLTVRARLYEKLGQRELGAADRDKVKNSGYVEGTGSMTFPEQK